jgi:hypothetical protein
MPEGKEKVKRIKAKVLKILVLWMKLSFRKGYSDLRLMFSNCLENYQEASI